MKFIESPLPGSYVIEPEPYQDQRGWFARFFCKEEFKVIGHDKEWVQLNHSVTFNKGALRGMHFQKPPYREIKMVKCIVGVVYDVIIDIRKNSPKFMQWYGLELSAANRKMLYIPEGFAHGFQCLTDHCELIYHHSEYYSPDAESGVRYNDPAIGIQWPLAAIGLSPRDQSHPYLDESFKGI